ncbi:hypothetical protein Taro_003983 [Colocasia esculenta]|uniref:Arp2/3 complex 34 kDa subunit n=1 Tax=Colocasia esculenta TaxID=4460 RepID=A0A843TKZ2_COLES|nr:hypothetical protein [Colocasia esculenta]
MVDTVPVVHSLAHCFLVGTMMADVAVTLESRGSYLHGFLEDATPENGVLQQGVTCTYGAPGQVAQASASDSRTIYLSISTPVLSPDVSLPEDLGGCALQEIRRVYSDVMEVVEAPKEGFTLTVKIDLARLPQRKGSLTDLPEKFTVIFPMRFSEDSDVVIAASLFQELMDVGYSPACAKAPACTWSPIPPPELRGESLQSLSTNGGFVSFEIYSYHAKGQKMENTIWILLNFYAFVKYYIKCTRGFIQRKMRQRLESLSEALEKARIGEDKDCENVQESNAGRRCAKRLLNVSKSRVLRRTCGALTRRIGRIFLPIRIQVLARFRRRWLRMPKVSSLRKYTKLD